MAGTPGANAGESEENPGQPEQEIEKEELIVKNIVDGPFDLTLN